MLLDMRRGMRCLTMTGTACPLEGKTWQASYVDVAKFKVSPWRKFAHKRLVSDTITWHAQAGNGTA